MPGPWAGIDVGGRRKGFHLAVVDERGLVDGPRRAGSVADAVRQIGEHNPALTAIDSPIVPAPRGHRLRECERRLSQEICGIRWTPDLPSLEANRGYYGWVLHGLELYLALERAGLDVIECFPTASWTRWAGPRDARTRAAWTREALAALALPGLPGRTNQDDRDAIAAALTAREHSLGRTEQYGEIVVPQLQ
jgi:predicted nuclease with RNAse H fold